MSQGFELFDTALGRCAVVWGAQGIVGLKLPERDDGAMRARIGRHHPEAHEAAAPPDVAAVVEDVRRLLAGEYCDLSSVVLDMSRVSDFDRQVYTETRSIPPGETRTYGELAARLGDPFLSRGVGQALGRNPFAIIVPCHRVLAAGGRAGGFSARGGVETKRRLLEIEDARGLHPTLPWHGSR